MLLRAKVNDETSIDRPLLDLLKGVVNIFELATLTHDTGSAFCVELEGFGEIHPGADNRSGDR
jgi:hypothetical protein